MTGEALLLLSRLLLLASHRRRLHTADSADSDPGPRPLTSSSWDCGRAFHSPGTAGSSPGVPPRLLLSVAPL